MTTLAGKATYGQWMCKSSCRSCVPSLTRIALVSHVLPNPSSCSLPTIHVQVFKLVRVRKRSVTIDIGTKAVGCCCLLVSSAEFWSHTLRLGPAHSLFLQHMCFPVGTCCAGHAMINGIERPLKAYKSLVGFVPQEDIMIRNLTVEENLRFCAFSRLPSSWSDAKKVPCVYVCACVHNPLCVIAVEDPQRRTFAVLVSVLLQLQLVYETLQLLGLYEIRHSQIGDERVRGISGGQRKRVNIGMELAADPTVLFLGE